MLKLLLCRLGALSIFGNYPALPFRALVGVSGLFSVGIVDVVAERAGDDGGREARRAQMVEVVVPRCFRGDRSEQLAAAIKVVSGGRSVALESRVVAHHILVEVAKGPGVEVGAYLDRPEPFVVRGVDLNPVFGAALHVPELVGLTHQLRCHRHESAPEDHHHLPGRQKRMIVP